MSTCATRSQRYQKNNGGSNQLPKLPQISKKNRNFVILVAVLVVGIIISSIGMNAAKEPEVIGVSATLNGTPITWETTEEAAADFPAMMASGEQTLAFDEECSAKISVTLTGQSSGKNYSASTKSFNFFSFFGASPISVDENNFKFDANTFEEGEIVVIEAEIESDEAFQDTVYEYFSFVVEEPQENVQPETSQLFEDTNTSEAAPFQPEFVANTKVYFNGFMFPRYSTREQALSSPISIGEDVATCSIDCAVDDNVKRVRIWTEDDCGTSHDDEYFLYDDNGFSDTIDLSAWSNETILIGVCIADNNVPSNNDYSYIAIELSKPQKAFPNWKGFFHL